MLGGQESPYLGEGAFELSFGYRYQESDRHFRGDSQERNRKREGSEVINTIHLLDLGLTYAITERISASISLPFLVAERSQPIRDDERRIVGRNYTHATGIGDLSLMGRLWALDTSEHMTGNISIGLGVKFPTGKDDVKDDFKAADGTRTRRTVDQSIQPGDGGYGAILELQAFQVVFEKWTLFGQGTYLFNPRETNGVETGRGRPSESEMSVVDQYVARAGVAVPIAPEHGWSAALAGRIEGVPVRDLIGGSDGFRRPGYAVSVEPSLIYAIGSHRVSVSVPIAVYRNRQKSVPDDDDDAHGDAAFADYMILVSYSYRFGGREPLSESPAESGPSVLP